jgi:hypothetical protein
MTDPFRPDDDLVSAVLDGEATADERAQVEADPVLTARLAEFAAVRDQVAAPVPEQDHLDRERAIDAAKVAIRHQAPVVALRSRSELPRFLAVAAAVLLVFVSIGFLASRADLDDEDSASSDDATALEADDSGGDSSAGAGSATDSEGAETAADEDAFAIAEFDGEDLGPVPDEAALATVLRERLEPRNTEDTASTPTTTSGLPQPDVVAGTVGSSQRCQAGLVEADPDLSGLLARATTTLDGTPAVVYVYGTPDGRQRIVVVAADDCQTLAVFDL